MTDLSATDSALLATTCGLGAGFAWGLADFLGAKAARALHPTQAAGAVQLLGALAFTPLYLLCLPHHGGLKLAGAAYATGGGVLLALGLMAFFGALKAGPVSIVAPLGSAYPLVTTAVAVAWFAARPTDLQLLGIGLILVGVIACSGVVEARRSDRRITRGVRLACATLVLWGVALALLGQGVDRLGWETSTLVQVLASTATFAVVLGGMRLRGVSMGCVRPLLRSRSVLGAGLVLLAGNVIFNVGLGHAGVAGATIVAAVSACYPALTMVLAIRHLGEQVRFVPLGGALVAIAGVGLSAV